MVLVSSYVWISLLSSGIVGIEQLQQRSLNTLPQESRSMRDFQLPIETFFSSYLDLTDPDNELVDYFRHIRMSNIRPVLSEAYSSRGPKGYGAALWLSRMLKIRMGFYSDRILAKRLSECAMFRILCGLNEQTPAHNTYHTFRRHVSVSDYRTIHRNFVLEAHEHGLLDIQTARLPKTRRQGLILIGDSTPLLAYCSTVGEKQPDGGWLFTDSSAAFGRPHHKHKYPVGHKAHSLITITGIPLASIVSPRNDSDQAHIFELLRLVQECFPELVIAYVVLDSGYDAEEIHKTIYEEFNAIPIIIRKRMKYPRGFADDGTPTCSYGFRMKKLVLDYSRARTKYACERTCRTRASLLFACPHLDDDSTHGLVVYTRFKDNYRKYGPAIPNSIIYRALKPFRTAIERDYGLLKENRYRMEVTNTYMGMDNITKHVIEHDVVLTQDSIYQFVKSGKRSSVTKA